jgi:hypothetical protein
MSLSHAHYGSLHGNGIRDLDNIALFRPLCVHLEILTNGIIWIT